MKDLTAALIRRRKGMSGRTEDDYEGTSKATNDTSRPKSMPVGALSSAMAKIADMIPMPLQRETSVERRDSDRHNDWEE